MRIQTGPVGLPQVTALAKRFANVKIILDHLGWPDVSDGPPYAAAQSLFDLASIKTIYSKLTRRIMGDAKKGKATPETLFTNLAQVFGANRLAWGSNFPTSPGTLADALAIARDSLAAVSDEDRGWIFARTAQSLYPALAN